MQQKSVVTDIPTNLDQVWIVFSLIFLALIFVTLINLWPQNFVSRNLPRLHERFGANVIGWSAIMLMPIWLMLVLLTIQGSFELWVNPVPKGNDNLIASRLHYLALVGLMGALAALLSAPLALYRVFTTERQTKATEEGLITDRINKAVEGLGSTKVVKRQRTWSSGKLAYEKGGDGQPDFSKPIYEEITAPNLEVRIGSLLALERISQDSLRDYLQIVEIICVYIRENAPSHGLEPTPELEQRP